MFATAKSIGIALRKRGLCYTSSTFSPRVPGTGDLRGEKRTFRWFLKRAESENPYRLILVAK